LRRRSGAATRAGSQHRITTDLIARNWDDFLWGRRRLAGAVVDSQRGELRPRRDPTGPGEQVALIA